MRVLICIPCLLTGGTEIQTLNLVNALIEGGHEVTTVCYFEFSLMMVEKYKKAGSDVILLTQTGERAKGIQSIKFLYQGLKNIVRKFKPDVAHVQYMAPGAIPIIILKLLGIKKIIATLHTFADIYPRLTLIHFLQRYCVTAFTCITKLAEESFFRSAQHYNSDYKLKKRNHFTIYNTLSPYFKIGRKDQHSSKLITLGVVSRLETIKGMDLIIPAYANLKEKNPNICLLVIGDGTLKENMIQQAIKNNINDSIEWVGRLDQNELYHWYKRIDIFLMPSRSEGFGLSAIEAMASGCAVVASNIGGLPEVIEHDISGILHMPEDIEDMVIKVDMLINDCHKRSQIINNALKKVSDYTFEKYAMLLNHLYSELK